MTVQSHIDKNSGSFRDPSGYIFRHNNEIYRYIAPNYLPHYRMLMDSGLYQKLVDEGLLISHQEKPNMPAIDGGLIIKPTMIPFISYPYEWCFSQIKDAALTTLKIQKIALEHNMVLKDANAYNIQFFQGKPILIDTLSFEKYEENAPWVAYQQFCQHFLVPLCLATYTDVFLPRLTSMFCDGIPLEIAVKLLPTRAHFNLGLQMHLFAHVKFQKNYNEKPKDAKSFKIKKSGLLALIFDLERVVNKLHFPSRHTEWGDYYTNTNYTSKAILEKENMVAKLIDKLDIKTVWDVGSNDGRFSRMATDKGLFTISSDIDPVAVEKNYLQTKVKNEKLMLPLIVDLNNPSPNIGWNNQEREAFFGRAKSDLILALALIHHIAISNNVPFDQVASFFAPLCRYLMIEFVPKDDSKVQRLLASRKDVFVHYNQPDFEKSFSQYFNIKEKILIKGTKRTLYLMETKTRVPHNE
ncbi:MAG: SAM-dependent methyltransferase [Patescibacteria group bacterium]|jgi:hypothetical protein